MRVARLDQKTDQGDTEYQAAEKGQQSATVQPPV
jgi:hypothetical protein